MLCCPLLTGMNGSALTAALVAGLLASGSAGGAAELAGRLELTEKGRPALGAGADLDRGVVWFEPARKGRQPAPVTAEMRTLRKQFQPQLLIVPVGSTVRFPNQDPILHNVFSVSGGNSFDLGLVGAGAGKEAVFREPGVVAVFCNVHHAMFAHVVVVDTPHFARIQGDGRFRLVNVPDGPGTLVYWHERGELARRAVSVPSAPLELAVPITRPRLPPHKNKFGKSYDRGGYG